MPDPNINELQVALNQARQRYQKSVTRLKKQFIDLEASYKLKERNFKNVIQTLLHNEQKMKAQIIAQGIIMDKLKPKPSPVPPTPIPQSKRPFFSRRHKK